MNNQLLLSVGLLLIISCSLSIAGKSRFRQCKTQFWHIDYGISQGGVGKSVLPACMARVKAGRVHLCRVAGNRAKATVSKVEMKTNAYNH